MKMNNTTRFILSKLFAIAIVVLGIHFMVAYCTKTLPFGIKSEVLVAIWGFMGMGCIIGLIVVAIGLYYLFKEIVEEFIKKLMWQKRW